MSLNVPNRFVRLFHPCVLPMNSSTRSFALACFALWLPSAPTAAQGSREQMWPAPTAEDWQKPCLITWQRTYEDALAESRATGKPILVCINMDGEIASEHYAGVRYRQAEIAALYEPYVCVIASVYRHTPRDHDDDGRRIPCPRFGSVTCGEHIAIEPGLFQKFMDGKRIAPRHIGVQQGQEEAYDVYYAFDTDSVFAAIADGVTRHAADPSAPVRSDRSIVERMTSRDSRDQTAVEDAYREGDKTERRRLLLAAQNGEHEVPVDMLRLAIFGLDPELGQLARQALARTRSPGSIDLILEALRVPMPSSEREALIGALDRIGESSIRARTLAVVHRGLAAQPSSVDAEAWTQALSRPDLDSAGRAALQGERLQSQSRILAGDDPQAHVELAEAMLDQALGSFDPLDRGAAEDREVRALLQDAHDIALRAEELGARGWQVDAAIGLSAYHQGQFDQALERAARAVPKMTPGAGGTAAFAMLKLFARTHWRQIARAIRLNRPWDPEQLADVHAAFTALGQHPLCTDSELVLHYDILNWLGAPGEAVRVLDEALERFPESWDLHDRLRTRIFKERGKDGLEAVYEELLRREDASTNLEWFAGYASLVAAEFYRRSGHPEQALAAYERGIAHYERSVETQPESRTSADHYVALAIAGRARIAYEAGDDRQALEAILASFDRAPEAAATPDGLGLSPVSTAQMLLARLSEKRQTDAALRLKGALDDLAPELLELPAFERGGPPR